MRNFENNLIIFLILNIIIMGYIIMLEKFLNYKKCIPDDYKKSVYDIDFNELYKLGKRVIFFDLDNTFISYKETMAGEKEYNFIRHLEEIGYEVMLVSNSHKKRVKRVADYLKVKYLSFSLKPLKLAFRRAKRKLSKKYSNDQIIEIGDQLLTDVYGSKGLGIYTILVKPIDNKTEVFVTRINRRREEKIINKIKNKDIESYITKLQQYERDKNEEFNL